MKVENWNVVTDGGDIDNEGHWQGADICCLGCREQSTIAAGCAAQYMTIELYCFNCGETFAVRTI